MSNYRFSLKTQILAVLLIPAMALTGCLITVDSDSQTVSRVWEEDEVRSLEAGISDRESVRETFGDPLSLRTYADGREVWTYRNRYEKETEVGMFLVFHVDVEEESVETLTIEFVDGTVSNYWIEDKRLD